MTYLIKSSRFEGHWGNSQHPHEESFPLFPGATRRNAKTATMIDTIVSKVPINDAVRVIVITPFQLYSLCTDLGSSSNFIITSAPFGAANRMVMSRRDICLDVGKPVPYIVMG